jgi:hypothetical protein
MARSVSRVPSPGSPSVEPADGFASLTLIYGVVASAPTGREVSGVTLLDIDVRSKSTEGQPASVSVVWAAVGDEAAPSEGDLVLVSGFTRRRFFRSGGVTVSRTEVEATSLLVNPDRRKRRRVVESSGFALERLTG